MYPSKVMSNELPITNEYDLCSKCGLPWRFHAVWMPDIEEYEKDKNGQPMVACPKYNEEE